MSTQSIMQFYCSNCDLQLKESRCTICGERAIRVENRELVETILNANFAIESLGIADLEQKYELNARSEWVMRYAQLLFHLKSRVSRAMQPKIDAKIELLVQNKQDIMELSQKLKTEEIAKLHELAAMWRQQIEQMPDALEMQIIRISKIAQLNSVLNLLNQNSFFEFQEFNYKIKEEKIKMRKEKVDAMKNWVKSKVKERRVEE